MHPEPARRATIRLAALVAGVASLLAAGPIPRAGGTDVEPRLMAVRFDVGPAAGGEADGPLSAAPPAEVAHYASLQVDHAGVTRRLQPVAGPVTASATSGATGLAAELDGLRLGPAAEGFDDALSQAFASPSVGHLARIEADGSAGPAVVDLALPRALGPGDYLLVQEAGGDDRIEIEALGPDGASLGRARVVGPPYRWNSGRQTPEGTDQWASVVAPSDWAVSGTATTLRIRATRAEVKVLLLEPAVDDVAPTAPAVGVEPAVGAEPAVGTATEAAPAIHTVARAEPGPVVPAVSAPADPAAAVPVPVAVDRVAAPTALAMTGVRTEPWVLVGLATGCIFVGYTAVAAFRRPAHRATPGEPSGHAQLDALGFE